MKKVIKVQLALSYIFSWFSFQSKSNLNPDAKEFIPGVKYWAVGSFQKDLFCPRTRGQQCTKRQSWRGVARVCSQGGLGWEGGLTGYCDWVTNVRGTTLQALWAWLFCSADLFRAVSHFILFFEELFGVKELQLFFPLLEMFCLYSSKVSWPRKAVFKNYLPCCVSTRSGASGERKEFTAEW